MIGASCQVTVDMSVGPYIPSEATSVDNGLFTVVWTGYPCVSGGCVETYDVRIDRLP
jgi:hypothetical protein